MASTSVYFNILKDVQGTVQNSLKSVLLQGAIPTLLRKLPLISESDRPLPCMTISPETKSNVAADMAQTTTSAGFVHNQYPVLLALYGDGQDFSELGLQDWLELLDQMATLTFTPTLATVPEVFDCEIDYNPIYDERALMESKYTLSAMRLMFVAREPRNR